ncbi:MAG: OmpA family protein, partial [Mycobacterium sp.]|nr:OmpA family protein [Mycobacterium sp.]
MTGEAVRGFWPSARFVIATATLLAAVSACSGGGGDAVSPSPKVSRTVAPGTNGAPLGVAPMTLASGQGHVELTALSRTSGNTVTGQFRVSNDSSGELELGTALFDSTSQNYTTANGIGLLDGTGNKLYLPLSTTDNRCLCSDLSGKVLPPGGTADLYAVFPAPPGGVARVSVTMPLTVPIQDVPIATGPVRPLPDQNIDPATASLAPPRILPVRSTVEGEEESTDDSGGDRAVRLSSDVLFALNKADLTPRALALLDGVARQIDQSTAKTVKVDGYTDTTGNDAINQPLSGRRARAVAQRLQSLVTRQGVTFQEAGHGSQDPVASNNTADGRRKNRRTTVTFARPLPKQTAPPASGGAPYRWAKGAAPVVGSAPFTAPAPSGLKVEVNSLHRDASGVTTLVWTIRNNGGGPVDISARFDNFRTVNAANAGTASGLELVDTAGKLHYQPLHASDNRCLCTEFVRAGAKNQIGAGESVTYADIYELPTELRTVELQIPW